MKNAQRKTFYKNDPFWMTSKYGGNCRKCSEAIKKGEEIWYYPKDKLAYCEKCGKEAEKDFLSAVEDEEFYNRQYSEKLRKIASSLSGFRGAVVIMGEHGVAVAEKGGKIYTAPLDENHSFEFGKMEELKDPKSPAFLKEVNKVFGKKLKMKDFEKSASTNPWDDEEENPEALHWKLNHDEDEEEEDDFFDSAQKFFHKDWERIEHYSGRGMFGKSSRCALRSDVSPNSQNGKKFLKATGASVDSLGLGFVYYLR